MYLVDPRISSDPHDFNGDCNQSCKLRLFFCPVFPTSITKAYSIM